jgi:hypothetical protein
LVQSALVQTTADPLERVETRFLRNIIGGEAGSEPAVAKIGVRLVVHGGREGVAADGAGVSVVGSGLLSACRGHAGFGVAAGKLRAR